MDSTRSSGPAAEDTGEATMTPERLAIIRQRLASGYYRRPEILERIAAAVWRVLGRPD
jgi:hypothetical protein